MTYLSGSGAIVGRIRLPTRPSREARVTYHGRAIDSRNMRPTMDDKCATQFFGPITENEIELIPDSSLYGPNSRPLYLIVVNGGIPGSMIRLKRDGTSIGRSATNDFRLHDPSISRHHAAIGADTSGELWLSDLASTNGTFLNGNRVDAARCVRAAVGTLGDTEGCVCGPAAAPRVRRIRARRTAHEHLLTSLDAPMPRSMHRYVELRPFDVLKFGLSTREYVLMHEGLAR